MSKNVVPEKQLTDLLREVGLDDSFLMGYYGGGNFGDELLFEVLQHLFHERDYRQVSFLYQDPDNYSKFHHDLGYDAVDSSDKIEVLKAVFSRRKLVIGGGGLWGLDVNANVVLMSVLLFFARLLLGKQVYLIGVGYYGSTTRLGHFAAWLAGKAANQILARDQETYDRFRRINSQTYLCDDIAFNVPHLRKKAFVDDIKKLESAVDSIDRPTVLISLRRFKANQVNPYAKAVERWLANNPTVPVVLALMEPRQVDPSGYKKLQKWQAARSNARVIDFSYNPVALYYLLQRYRHQLSYIGPQFHVLLIAHLAGLRLMPLAYDNKVSQLLSKLEYDGQIPISSVSSDHLRLFVGEGQDE